MRCRPQRPRRANLINSAILCGLVGWLLGFLLTGEGPLSHAGLIAALMAPLSLPRLPSRAALIGRGAARSRSTAPPTALARSAARCAAIACSTTLTAQAPRELSISRRCSMRCSPRARDRSDCRLSRAARPAACLLHSSAATPASLRRRCAAASRSIGAQCASHVRDSESIRLAARKCRKRLRRRSCKGQTSAVDPGVAAACDRQVGRRIVHLLIDTRARWLRS